MLRIASLRQLHASAVARRTCFSAARCSSAFSGKATKRGTGQFLIDNNVSLCHLLKKTDLYVNCIVHGGARFKQRTVDPATALIFGVLSNKSNMVQVYAHDDTYTQPAWAKAALQSVFESGVSREQLVCMADVGLCRSKDELQRQLERALQQTGLDVMDICTFRIPSDLSSAEMDSTLAGLEAAYKNGVIQAVGLHCPAVRTQASADNFQELFLPEMVEYMCDHASRKLFSVPFEIVSYEISPTTEVPATYGRLSGEQDNEQMDERLIAMMPEEMRPTGEGLPPRKFTRMAIGPLLARPPETGVEDLSEFAVPLVSDYLGDEQEQILASRLDELCPELTSTPRLEDKAIRAVLSTEVELLYMHLEDAILLPSQVSLRPEQLLHISETERIFGNFVIPRTAFKRVSE